MSVFWCATSIPSVIEKNLFRLTLPGGEAVAFMDSVRIDIEEHISIDKQWGAIHYFLTGRTAPFDDSLSRSVFGEYDLDQYGLEMYTSAREVRKIARSFQLFSMQKILSLRSQSQLIEEYKSEIAVSGGGYGVPHFPYIIFLIEALRDFYDFSAIWNRGVYISLG